jgi:phospholipase C
MLRLAKLTPLFVLAACGSTPPQQAPTSTVLPGPDEWNREVTPPSDEEAASARASCGYAAGALPAETQGASAPSGTDIPVDTIVIVMMENRSFDHYFQLLPEHGQPDVEVAPQGFTNPDVDGSLVAPMPIGQHCFVDTAHGWGSVHEQVNGGAMDGFIRTNEGNHELPMGGSPDLLRGTRAMQHHGPDTLPFYYWLASEFSIADHYHCSMLGPTWPNRMYLYAATSGGLTSNTFTSNVTTLMDYLELREVPWAIYATGTPGFGVFVDKLLDYQGEHLKTIDDFYVDAAAGTLPKVVFVDPNLGREGFDTNDEHPPAMAQYGQRFVADVVKAMGESPQWSRSATFITYDEHGGLYDHVPPPDACAPDDRTDPDADPPVGFTQLGVRVPLMVVSPFAKKHFVSHKVYDHTSITRFVEARFVMPALTGRDANAEAPFDMFDFESPPFPAMPTFELPAIDEAMSASCAAVFD